MDTSDPENVRRALRPNTRLVYLEIAGQSAAAPHRCRGRRRAWPTTPERWSPSTPPSPRPSGCRPAELGADFVVQSLTKYICGHGDAIGGAVSGRRLRTGQAALARHPHGRRAQPLQRLADPARSGHAAHPDGRSPGGRPGRGRAPREASPGHPGRSIPACRRILSTSWRRANSRTSRAC